MRGFACLVLLCAFGCGDDSAPPPGTTDAGPRVDAGGGGGDEDAGPIPPGTDAGPIPTEPMCPETLPADGTSCDGVRDELICEYGDDPRPACRPVAQCDGGTWNVNDPSCEDLPGGVTCPATYEAANRQACSEGDPPLETAFCSYEGLSCACTNCDPEAPVCGGGPNLWYCEAANETEGCPRARPLLGRTCETEGLFCDYGCTAGVSRECSDGVWVFASREGGCPMSTREVKREIDYLDGDERRAIAEQTLSTRLATYDYVERVPGYEGRQLGFILEDEGAGQSFARDGASQRVNLYGYASMLLATVQEQQSQIDALRTEVEALRDARSCEP